jgi:hypothetical protein
MLTRRDAKNLAASTITGITKKRKLEAEVKKT